MKGSLSGYLLNHPILIIFLSIMFGWFLLQISGILILVFLAFIFTSALLPVVEFLCHKKVPRILSVLLIYLLIILLIVLIIVPLSPLVISQTQSLIKNIPEFLTQAANLTNITINEQQIRSFLTSRIDAPLQNALSIITAIFGGFFALITFLFISFYLLLDHKRIIAFIAALFPKKLQQKIPSAIHNVEKKLGLWVRGQVILSLFVGIMTWIAYMFLGLPYAIPLAILAGVMEIVPTIGPLIGYTPALILAFTISPTMFLSVFIAYIVIQILEGNILVPKIMEQAVGLHPLIVLLSVIIGATLLGIIGALLAIPFVAMMAVIWKEARK